MAIREDLNGKRLQVPGHPIIFLVLNGRKSLIPSQYTYENLFMNWQNLILDEDIFEIDDGDDIDPDTRLVRSSQTKAIYLLDKNRKSLISSERVFEQYNFNSEKIIELDEADLEKIEDGPVLEVRH